ncbi:MAG: alpha/beta hydrolase [Pseudomonadota bacterium]
MVQSFTSDGFDIAFIDVAPEAPSAPARAHPVLLIHGFASRHEVNWVDTGWVNAISRDGWRVIALDNRGHGASGQSENPADYGAPLMADDAVRLLDQLRIERAHVMGYSMGARITAFMAMRVAERVQTATFAGLGVNMIRGFTNSEAIAAALEATNHDDIDDEAGRMFRAFAEMTRSHLPSLAACIRSSRAGISADDVARITRPVLVAAGTEDEIAGSATGLADLVPSAEAFDIEGRDHMKAVGDKSYKAAFLDFITRHDT